MTRLLLALTLALAGCCTVECEPENLPFTGHPSTPEELFKLAQHAATFDCCEILHTNLSQATRDEHSETKFCLFWESIDIPDPYDYRLVDVVAKGSFVGTIPWNNPGELLIYVEYQEQGKPNLLAQLLVVQEPDERGHPTPHLAVQDQMDRGMAFDAGR